MNCPDCSVEISEHEASRCLDYWVAKDVLDLNCLKDPPYGILLPADLQVKRYSREIAPAWNDVMEKLRQMKKDGTLKINGRLQIECRHWVTKDKIFAAGFDDYGTLHPAGYASTGPLAICRLALKTTVVDQLVNTSPRD